MGRFCHGGYAEKGALILQKTGDGDRAVAVGVGLDDCHRRHAGLFLYGRKIPGDGIQVYFYIGMVEIHGINSQKGLSPWYHR